MTTDMMVCDSKKATNATPSRKRCKTVVSSCRATVAEDIIMEVLLRLPIKSVVRFRAVCRFWATLLSSEEFCRLHRAITRAAGVPLKLLHFCPTAKLDATAVYSCSLSTGPGEDELLFTLGSRVKVLTPAPCHGLTLLYDAFAKAYYICNAATRAVSRLPPSPDVAVAYKVSTGLGFDPQTRQYKVMRLINGMRRSHEQDTIRCEVYTPGGSHGDCWRPAAGGVPFALRRFAISALSNANPPVFANGFLHWLMEPPPLLKRQRGGIVYFSVMEETLRCVGSPPFPFHLPSAYRASARHLVEMDNELCLIQDLRGDPYGSTLEIWRLVDYNSGDWSLDRRINLSGRDFGREMSEPETVRVIGSIDTGKSGKKMVIATRKHKVHEKFQRKVHTYDLGTQVVDTILSVTETITRRYGPPSGFCLFEDCLAPVHKTDAEIALSTAKAKAVKEILLRLPAKSVVQSKLICKQWLGLIKSEGFIQSYSEHKNMGRRPKIMLVGKGLGPSAFSFAPLDTWLPEDALSQCALLATKVVCSKPCHGMNLLSTETHDYLYNPGTGFHRVYHNQREKKHPPLQNKNVSLTFDPVSHEHAIVEIIYHQKNFDTRQYKSVCSLRLCNSGEFARRQYSVGLPLPPLPMSDMPAANVGGVLYWMSDPRLGRSRQRAIVSFDVAMKLFDVVPCPSCIAVWSSASPCSAFAVELQGALCAVLADPVADSLDVWRLEGGRWGRACLIRLQASPDYSVGTNVVVPLAVDPEDGRILLSTGRRIGAYDPAKETVQDLYSLDQVPLVPIEGGLSVGEINRLDSEILPLVPMLYEESLACCLPVGRARRLSFC